MVLKFEEYTTHIEREIGAFQAAIDRARLQAEVSSCPGWTTTDLLDHVGEMLAFWTEQVWAANISSDDPIEPADLARRAKRPIPDLGIELLRALKQSGPNMPAWNWSSVNQNAAWVARRMANELAVHRVDAELVTGPAMAVRPALAVDGISELLEVFVPADPATVARDAPVLTIAAPERTWTVAVTPEGVAPSTRQPDTRLVGPTSDLLLELWGRPSTVGGSGEQATMKIWRDLASFI